MDFNLTEAQAALQARVRDLAEGHLKAGALARAHDDGYPRDIAAWMAANGLLGLTIPKSDGGLGGTLMDAVLAIETVSQICPRSADVLQAGNFGAIRVLSAYGSADQKKRYLSKILRGEMVITVAMSEPEAGSAATDLTTSAVADGNGFRVSGTKLYVTHGKHADLFLAYVRYAPGLDGIGSVLIERGQDGFKTSQPTRFLSGEEWVRIDFDNVHVPPENVLLREGGFKKQIAGFNVERLGNSARSLGLGRLAFNLAREHALSRQQFGRPLCEFQGLQWKFAEMEMRLQAAQLLLYRAAVNADAGFPSAMETAIAKVMCNAAGFETANDSMQILGGLGYSESSLVEYCFRRTRGWMIAGGSTEMMKNRIAEVVFGRSFPQRPPRPPKPAQA
jgi:alkylation response protein AidB-like acyl-CoA dehydrogenase